MKKIVKFTAVAAAVLTLATAGVSSATAGGWPVRVGVVGGFAAGAIVSRTIGCPPSAYYIYPPRIYAAPICAPFPVVAPSARFCYGPTPVIYPFRYPAVRVGFYEGRLGYFRRR
jgi:hypothetical protein